MNLSIDFFQSVTREGDSYIGFHSHTGYELVYYVNGSGETQIADKKHAYEAGRFAVIQPGVRHDELRRTDTDVIYLVFFYDNTAVPLETGFYYDHDDGRIKLLLDRMSMELSSKSRYYNIQLHCLLTEIIVEIGRMANTPSVEEADHKLAYAKSYIEQYFCEKMDLSGLARTLGYSYDYFRHIFKTYTGYAPMQYVVQQRIERAKQMLIQSDKPITTISVECGFASTPQFCTMFKKQVSVSPRRFRTMQ
ncbi:helix-turn-helix transcriptional regulator [Paenibacillus contaminans]|uniref:HTH araC/xylS-type domain-containing protein n=1 Tax=Paenibacillus contaminans TaxID=450362 RepID=A0A329MIF2_9BACL|nr:AraC family transcriptional regulator [Paenibacillus contaminans]RAV19615.1 hypothetical protein DQG23_19320 [Paenibacillus contaminans]